MALLPFLTSSLALAVAATLASAVASVQEVRADLPVADSCSSLGEASSCIDVLADEYADESLRLLQHAAQFNLLQVQRQQQHEQMSQNPSQQNSEFLNMINQGIAQEVIPMMNSMLPAQIKKEGKDPLANVMHKDKLDVTFTAATVLSSEITFASVKIADGSGPFSGLVEDVANIAGVLQEAAAGVPQKAAGKYAPSSGQPGVAATFEGGGYLSVGNFVGVVVGLLKASGGDLEALFSRFSILSSISGGSWFISQLIYSPRFYDLVTEMAADVNTAAILFNTQYIKPLLTPGNFTKQGEHGIEQCFVDNLPKGGRSGDDGDDEPKPISPQIAQTFEKLLKTLPKDMKHMVAGLQTTLILLHLVHTGMPTWIDFIQMYFQSSAGIGVSLPLGETAINNWAKGKLSLTCTSILTPGIAEENTTHPEVYVYKGDREHPSSITYHAASPLAFYPKYTPAKFSVVLGAGIEQPSYLPFCAVPGCFGYVLDYQGSNGGSGTYEATSDLNQTFEEAFEKIAGRLPVSSVSAMASAALGPLATYGSMQLADERACLNWAMWIARAGPAELTSPWRQGEDVLSAIYDDRSIDARLVDKVAKAGLTGFIDGGYTDVNGIGQAVAAGATEVVSFLDGLEDNELVKQFAINSTDPDTSDTIVLFQSPSAAELNFTLRNSFQQILPQPGARFLTSISFGTVSCVTADNPWFGIEAGRKVQLHVINVNTKDIWIGATRDYYDYGKLVQEIVMAMNSEENAQLVQCMINKFFLGQPCAPSL